LLLAVRSHSRGRTALKVFQPVIITIVLISTGVPGWALIIEDMLLPSAGTRLWQTLCILRKRIEQNIREVFMRIIYRFHSDWIF